jgi:hypothetical protein
MIIATNLKNGTTFLMNGKPYQVVKYAHQKIARGGGTVKLSVRNLETGNLEKKTLNSSVKVEEITTVKRPLQYLYNCFYKRRRECKCSFLGQQSIVYRTSGQSNPCCQRYSPRGEREFGDKYF